MISAAKLMDCKTKSNDQLLKMYDIQRKASKKVESEDLSEDEIDNILENEEVEGGASEWRKTN